MSNLSLWICSSRCNSHHHQRFSHVYHHQLRWPSRIGSRNHRPIAKCVDISNIFLPLETYFVVFCHFKTCLFSFFHKSKGSFCRQRHIDDHTTNGALHFILTQGILDKFDFLIDGRAKKQIEVFIKKKPKFEEICKELEVCKTVFPQYLIRTLQVYNKYVEKTQEISSLEYFTFVRLDCEKLRKVIQFRWKKKRQSQFSD